MMIQKQSTKKLVEQAAEEAYEDRIVDELRTEIERQSEKSADYNEINGDEINIQNDDIGSSDYLGPFDFNGVSRIKAL
ncbi:hypothetical protein [Parasitella parasitica]|uniref:Uncharacterized protein n=1 Tax=Parasitella parasitica TaxID=35722 RepID=A0A0B7NBH9_9FUNG|nr:hypothetical protein [Parasitella parasitica]